MGTTKFLKRRIETFGPPTWIEEAAGESTDIPLFPEFETVFSGPDVTLNRTRYKSVLESFVSQVNDRAASDSHIPVHLGHPSWTQDHVPPHQLCGRAISARMENGKALFRCQLGAVRSEGGVLEVRAARDAYALGKSNLLPGTSIVADATKVERVPPSPPGQEEGFYDILEAELLAIDIVDIPSNRDARQRIQFESADLGPENFLEVAEADDSSTKPTDQEAIEMALTEEQKAELKALMAEAVQPGLEALGTLATGVASIKAEVVAVKATVEAMQSPDTTKAEAETEKTAEATATDTALVAEIEALKTELKDTKDQLTQVKHESAQGKHRETVDDPETVNGDPMPSTPTTYVSSAEARTHRESVQPRKVESYV